MANCIETNGFLLMGQNNLTRCGISIGYGFLTHIVPLKYFKVLVPLKYLQRTSTFEIKTLRSQFKHSTFGLYRDFKVRVLLKRLACGSPFQKHSDFEIPVKSSVSYLNYYLENEWLESDTKWQSNWASRKVNSTTAVRCSNHLSYDYEVRFGAIVGRIPYYRKLTIH